MKKYSPKESIEKGGNPKAEHSYIKFPRENVIQTTKKSTESSVIPDMDLIEQKLVEKRQKRYTDIHTHPSNEKSKRSAIHSGQDLVSFYLNTKMKSSVIAQRDKERGEVQGYTFLTRGEKDPRELESSLNQKVVPKKRFPSKFIKSSKMKRKKMKREELSRRRNEYTDKWSKEYYKKLEEKEKMKKFLEYEELNKQNPSQSYSNIKKVAKENDWGLRFVPAKGYRFSKETGKFEKVRGIEKAVSAIVGGFFAGMLLSFSPRLTGNIIIENLSLSNNGSFFIISSLIFSVILYFLLRKH